MILPERPGRPPVGQLAAIRAQMAAAAAAGAWRSGHPCVEESIAGVRCLRFAPADAVRGRVVHAHGGGFRMGSPEATEPYAARLAQACGVEVVCPAYRLAPEHPFPAGLNDVLVVTRALAAERGPLILAGDSAGGNLATAAALALAREGIVLAGLVLHSPWLDLTVSRASYAQNAASDPLFSRAAARDAAQLYLQDHPADDPFASPALGDVGGLPATFLSVGTGEVLRDDALAMDAALRSAGAAVDLVTIAGMEHTAVVRGPDLVGAEQVFDATRAFLDRLLAR